MFRKIISAEPLENYVLRLVFQDGNTELFDVKPMIEQKQLKVDTGGYGISWNDSIDLEF